MKDIGEVLLLCWFFCFLFFFGGGVEGGRGRRENKNNAVSDVNEDVGTHTIAVNVMKASFLMSSFCKPVMILSSLQDMDLIEVLWKQDVDLGFSVDLFNPSKPEGEGKVVRVEDDDVEKLKALEALKNETPADTTKVSEQVQKV